MTLFNDLKKTILLFFSFMLLAIFIPSIQLRAAIGGVHYHRDGKPCTGNHSGGLGLDNDMSGFGLGMSGYGMSAQLQDTYALTMLLQRKAELQEKSNHEGCEHEHGPRIDKEFNNQLITMLDKAITAEKEKQITTLDSLKLLEGFQQKKMDLQAQLDDAEKSHVNIHKLSEIDNAKILKSLQRKIDFLSDDLTFEKAILNGLGAGAFGRHYKASGNAKYDIITGALGAMTEPAGMVIAEHGKAFWSRVGIYLAKKWNRVSNVFFGTSTFTTRELEAWKSDIKELVRAFEEAYKRASGTASASHGLALRSGIFAEQSSGCADEACLDAACGEKKLVVEDPALKARKMYCQVQIANLLEEVSLHKYRSCKDKALCQRATLVEIALQALANCIARQTSLNELNSAAIFDEISVWRDLAVSALNSIVTATDPLADVKLRASSSYSAYGSYGSYGSGSSPY